MERRQLEYFAAVVECEGISRAAKELHVTQPALSQGIRLLERELGVELFQRIGRGVVLTVSGQAVLGTVRQTLSDFETIRQTISDVLGVRGGTLTIATMPSLAEDPLAELVARFHRTHPEVRYRLHRSDRASVSDIGELVLNGTCQLGFTETRGVPDLVEIPIAEQEFVALLPPGIPAPKSGEMPMEELLRIGLIVGPWWETSSVRRQVAEHCPDLVGNCVTVRTDYRASILALTLAGVGASLMPRYKTWGPHRLGVHEVSLVPRIKRPVYLLHRPVQLLPAVQAFRDMTLEKLGVEHPAQR